MDKADCTSRKLHEEMAGKVPLAIGTCGTMGSLLKREIEYFKGLELECVESRRQSERTDKEMASKKCNSWHGFRFLTDSWRKKKKSSSGILPGICSLVEVADLDLQELNGIPGFSYHNLKVDAVSEHECCCYMRVF